MVHSDLVFHTHCRQDPSSHRWSLPETVASREQCHPTPSQIDKFERHGAIQSPAMPADRWQQVLISHRTDATENILTPAVRQHSCQALLRLSERCGRLNGIDLLRSTLRCI